MLGVGPGGEDAGEHDVQVPRRVRLVHRQDLLAPACTLPQRGHHPQEEVRDVRAGLLAHQHGYGKGRAWQHPQEENLDFVGILGFYRNSLQFWMKKNGVRGNPNFGIGKTSKKQQ